MTNLGLDHVDSYVFRREGNKILYLLLKRRQRTQYGHLWQGVAGKKEGTETASEAVIRELKEETGLKPVRLVVLDHVTSFYQSFGDRVYLVPVFGVEVSTSRVQLSREHTDFKWVNVAQAQALLAWKQQKEAIQVLHEMLSEDDSRIRWSVIDLKP